MPTKKEEMEQKNQEQAAQELDSARLREHALKEMTRKQVPTPLPNTAQMQINPEEAKGLSNEGTFKLQLPVKNNEDWEKLLTDFKTNPKNEHKNNTLIFPTKDDAIKFFTDQAALNREFVLSQVDKDGNRTGFSVMSCGNGELFKGTFKEIEQQLTDALKSKPNDPKLTEGLATIQRLANPAQQYKAALQDLTKDNLPEPAPESNLSPFSKTPTPK